MKTKSKKARRAPTISQLVADRNAIARERIALDEHDQALRRKHKLGRRLDGLEEATYLIDETFPQGFPFIRPGKKLTGSAICQLDDKTFFFARSCGASQEDKDYLEKVHHERRQWLAEVHKARWAAYHDAERKVGIVPDQKRDEQLSDRIWEIDRTIFNTPAETPAELLAKARVVADQLMLDHIWFGGTIDKLLALSGRALADFGPDVRAFVPLYRELARMLSKMGGKPLEFVNYR